MKKLLLILLILPVFASAQFKQGAGFEYYQESDYKIYAPNIDYSIHFNRGDFAVLYKLQYKLGDFKAESLANLYMNKPSKDWTFNPTHSEFAISISYITNNITFKAKHICVHPIITDNHRDRNQLTGSSTKIGVYFNFD